MPGPAFILLVATLLPLAAFGLLLLAGRRMPEPLAGWLSTTFVSVSFLCSLLALYLWYTATWYSATAGGLPQQPWGYGEQGGAITLTARWLPVGDPPAAGPAAASASGHAGWLDVGLHVDSLTICMFLVVTLVAAAVQVFSIGYMRGDPRFSRYFAYLSLFCFAMLGLVLSGTLVQLFVFWEGVGFCSYLLIGFWFERKAAARAAFKAFVVNRVGDAALLVGFGLLFLHVGNTTFPHLWAALGAAGLGGDVTVAGGGAGAAAAIVPAGVMTLIGVCLFLGAAGKSAQFPLHTWLPDAMAGPSPVSALIHAATMVAAGVYLMARMFPVLTPDAKLVVAVAGCFTLLLGALFALVQTDIKKVLAYSTVSQLGYMMLAVGVGSWAGGLFHLVTHAFFKALLFLSAGSVIHAARHDHEMGSYGGLWRRMPVTAACMAVGVLAISGVGIGGWGLSGYHSKAHVLGDAAAFAGWATRQGGPGWYWLLFAVPAIVAYLTPLYMARLWMLTFWGKPRNAALYEQVREAPMMYVPMMALAVMSMIAGHDGLLAARPLLTGARQESAGAAERWVADAAAARAAAAAVQAIDLPPARPATTPAGRSAYRFPGWDAAWPTAPRDPDTDRPHHDADERPLADAEQAHVAGHRLEHTWLAWAWPVGLLAGVLLYLDGFAVARRVVAVTPVRWLHGWLANKMYVDELYAAAFIAPVLTLARVAGWLDRVVVDGVVNAAARAAAGAGRAAGWADRRVVDGAVAGVAQLAQDLGTAARAPQTGRVRAYVATLVATVVVGLAVAVAAVLWR
jgi:NADH-quinone oxidoreductase subunit L